MKVPAKHVLRDRKLHDSKVPAREGWLQNRMLSESNVPAKHAPHD